MNRIILLLLFGSTWLSVQAQKEPFTEEQFMWYVTSFHPIAQQAKLVEKTAENAVRSARGAFDPKLQGQLDQKYFDGKNYYQLVNAGLKVPTWYGIELKAGVDQNTGNYLNPQNTLPQNGLLYSGISVPLGKGLFIDQRRATLKEAQLFVTYSKAQQQNILNNLLFEATTGYWKWVEAWNQLQVFETSLDLAQERFRAVKQSFLQGDKPAIDTLEAFIQVQNRSIQSNEIRLQYQNASMKLSNYLWLDNDVPLEITDSLVPPALRDTEELAIPNNTFQEEELAAHPILQEYALKLAQLDIEKQVKVEALKPKLNLNYNPISEALGSGPVLSTENYKWGVAFSFPLFLRKERGDLNMTKIKLTETELALQQKTLELRNKVQAYFNEQETARKQILLFEDAVINYRRMLQGEKTKFFNGESSLFLVNSRENKLIDAQLKYISLKSKYHIAVNGYHWAKGDLVK